MAVPPKGIFFIAGKAFSWATVAKTAFLLHGIYKYRRNKKRAREAFNASQKDRKVTIRSNEAPQNIIYGETITSGPLVAQFTSGAHGEIMHLVIMLASHECEEISQVLIDNEPVSLDFEGWVTDGKYFKSVRKLKTERIVASQGTFTHDLVFDPVTVKAISATNVGGSFLLDEEGQPIPPEGSLTGSGNERVILEQGTAWTVSGRTITITGVGNFGGWVLDINYEYDDKTRLLQVKTFRGLPQGERDFDLERDTEGLENAWTAADDGKNQCRLHVRLDYDPDVFTSMPNISAVVKGKKVYDPRTGQTSWKDVTGLSNALPPGQNPVLCIRDYLMDTQIGFACEPTEIDDVQIAEDASICDDWIQTGLPALPPGITIPGYEREQHRFVCDGVVYGDASPKDNLEDLLTSCVGTGVYSAGKWRILPAHKRTAVIALDEDDLAGGAITTRAGAPFAELFNAVRGQYIDPSKKWALNDFPPYPQSPGPYQAVDNGQFHFRDFDFPFCQNPIRAQRMARLLLHKSRLAITDVAEYKLPAIQVQPGDVVQVTRAFDGWDKKEFVCVGRSFDPTTMRVQLSLQEESSLIYEEGFNELATPEAAANTNLPDPSYVAQIENVTVTSDSSTYDIQSDGSIIPYALVSWDALTTSDVLRGGYIQLEWKWAHETDDEWRRHKLLPDTTSFKISPVFAGFALIIKLRAVNGLEVFSQIAYIPMHRVGSVPPLGQPQQGGNLIRGASFTFGIEDWRSTVGVESSSKIGQSPTGLHKGGFNGTPSNAILDISELSGGSPVLCFAWSPPILLKPGQNYYAEAHLWGFFARGLIGVRAFDNAGEPISSFWFVSAPTSNVETSDFSNVDAINSYEGRGVIIPGSYLETFSEQYNQSSITVRFFVRGEIRQLSGYSGTSLLAFTKPMLVETNLLTTPSPGLIPWTEGPQAQTTPNSVASGMDAGSVVATPTIPFFPADLDLAGVSVFLEEVEVDNPRSRFFVTLTFETTLTQAPGGVYGKVEAILIASNATPNAQGEYDVVGTWQRDVSDVWGLADGSVRRVSSEMTFNIDIPPVKTRFSLTVLSNNGAAAQLLNAQMIINMVA